MECGKLRERFIDYVEGDASPLYGALIQDHLGRCRACREELGNMARVLELGAEALRHPAPHNRFDELRERMAVAERPMLPLPVPRIPRFRQALVAVSILAMIACWSSQYVEEAQNWVAPLGAGEGALEPYLEAEKTPIPLAAAAFVSQRIEIEKQFGFAFDPSPSVDTRQPAAEPVAPVAPAPPAAPKRLGQLGARDHANPRLT